MFRARADCRDRVPPGRLPQAVAIGLLTVLFGCGSTSQRVATDQLLVSSAVDNAVFEIDFSPLSGQTVYLDSQYIRDAKSNRLEVGDAASGYVISSLRQQMATCGCLIQDDRADAEFIVEARVGALGADASEVIYGVPQSNFLGAAFSAASLVTAAPPAPTIPEIAIARKDNRRAAAKVIAYAYHRDTRRGVWQSGKSQSETTAEDRWVLGAGPFQRGTIYEGVQFAGSELPQLEPVPLVGATNPVNLAEVPRLFVEPSDLLQTEPTADEDGVIPAGYSESIPDRD